MIIDKTLDEALVEILRTKKALEALRKAIKRVDHGDGLWFPGDVVKEHAAAKRASMDLTRKLADLRKGR